MKKITIQNMKNIKKLEFDLPQEKGVYLLTGCNGCGKTSLLVSMYRIGYHTAFAENFKSPSNVKFIDDFKDSEIRYTTESGEVAFRKKEKKWSPSPRTNKEKVFNDFNFAQVVCIKADGERLEATNKDLEERKPQKADISLINALNQIFEISKYDELKHIKIGQGRAREIYLIKNGSGKSTYYSEKQFSLGELLILKIVREVLLVKNNSLILIDEIEMALHPRVQKRLIKFLESEALKKELQIIISTHSSTMVKSVDKKRIILLEETPSKGIIEVINPCYSSRALGNIDFESGVLPDYLFLVEDENAEMLLESMINRLYKINEHSMKAKAKWNIVPIGGYREVIKFLIKSDTMIFKDIEVTAFLDKDVEDEHTEYIDKTTEKRSQIRFLPCTPELGVIELLENNIYETSRKFKEFSTYSIEISEILEKEEYKKFIKVNIRDRAKDKLDYIVHSMKDSIGKGEIEILKTIYSFYVQNLDESIIKSKLMPVIK